MIFHIGYPKTATTFLQDCIFPHLEGYHFLDRVNGLRDMGIHDLVFNGDQSFDSNAMKERIYQQNPEGNVIISHEGMIGNIYKGGITYSIIADRIRKLDPHAKIVITIREQAAMIESLYRQHIQEGGTLSFTKFLQTRNSDLIYFDPLFLRYHFLIKHYQNIFGNEKVLVLPLELLRDNKNEFIERLTSFIGSSSTGIQAVLANGKKINVGHSYYAIQFLRFLNHFIYSWVNPGAFIRVITVWKMRIVLYRYIDPYFINPFFSKRSLWKNEEQKNEYKELFKESNRVLLEMGIPGIKEGGFST